MPSEKRSLCFPENAKKAIPFFLLCFLVSCSPENPAGIVPMQRKGHLKKVTLFENADNKPKWRAFAESALLNENTAMVEFSEPEIRFYDGDEVSSVIVSRKAVTNLNNRNTVMTGSVTVRSRKENSVLKTEKLTYDSSLNKIRTRNDVEIIREDSVIRGSELTANPDLSDIEIKNQKTRIMKQ